MTLVCKYEDYTDKDLESLKTELLKALDVLGDVKMSQVQFCDRESDERMYLTCYDKPEQVDNPESLAFMFQWSFYDVSYKAMYVSNVQYIQESYPELFEMYFTDDVLTSDCEGIMLYVDRLEADIIGRKLSHERLDEVYWLAHDLQSLSDYPALDDGKLYEIEAADFREAWLDYGESDFTRVIQDTVNQLLHMQGYNHEVTLDNDDCDSRMAENLFYALSEKLNGGQEYLIEGSGVYILLPSVDKVIKHIGIFNKRILNFAMCCADSEDEPYIVAALSQKSLV